MAHMVCSNCGNSIWTNFYDTKEKNRKVCACCGTLVYDKDDIGENRRDELSRLENGFSFLHSYHFDGAKEIFSRVLDDHPDSVNARWGYLLAHYGIVYVMGFFDKKISPTYCFTEYDPQSIQYFSEQKKFKELLQFLSNEPELSAIYKEKAKKIDQALDDFAAAREEKEYDVFLCVKISKTLKSHPDQTGNTELDYPKALKLYKTLTQRGLKVFFSKVALDANPESDMDIWKNLVRSKKMLLITSKRDYLENDSPWVHSEWQRWLRLDQNGDKDHKNNLYIYLLGDMQPANLPEKLKRQVYTERDGMEEKLIEDLCKIPDTEKEEADPTETEPIKRETSVFAFVILFMLSLLCVAGGVLDTFFYNFNDKLWGGYFALILVIPLIWTLVEEKITWKQDLTIAITVALQYGFFLWNQREPLLWFSDWNIVGVIIWEIIYTILTLCTIVLTFCTIVVTDILDYCRDDKELVDIIDGVRMFGICRCLITYMLLIPLFFDLFS